MPLWRRLAPYLALVLLPTAVHVEVLFGRTFVLRDHLLYGLPVREQLRGALLEGRFPEWWDRIGFGTPFAANPAHAAFSPLAWLGALLPMPLGADLELLLWLALAGVGTALLARRLGAGALGAFVAGAALETSGYLTSLSVNGNLPDAAWVPWVAWAADRLAAATGAADRRATVRAGAALAVLLALQLAGGEPATILTAGFLALAVVAIRSPAPLRALGWLVGAGVAALALAAVAVLPALDLLGWSERSGGVEAAMAGAWSLHPARLLEWIWPRVLGDPVDPARNLKFLVADASAGVPGLEPSWSFSELLGLPLLALALVGGWADRRGRLLLGAAAFTVLGALGAYTPVWPLLRAVFPPEQLVRYPEKHVLGAVVLLCALAGAGLTRALESRGPRWLPWLLGAAGLLLAGAAAVAGLAPAIEAALEPRRALAGFVEPGAALRVSALAGGAAAGAAALVAAGLLLARSRRHRMAGAVLAAGALVGHLAFETRAVTRFAPREVVAGRPALLAAIPADPAEPPRICRPFVAPPPGIALDPVALARWSHDSAAVNTAARFGFQVLPGADAGQSGAGAAFWKGPFAALSWRSFAVLLGVRWLVLEDQEARFAGGTPITSAGGFTLLAEPGVRPRGFVTSRWAAVPQGASLALLAAGGRAADPGLVALEGAPPPAAEGSAGLAPCSLHAARPERVELACASPAGGYAVLLDELVPGWTATVDGVASPILRADGLFRAVAVGPGAHVVLFEYRTPGLRLGALVSALAVAALAVAAWWSRARVGPG